MPDNITDAVDLIRDLRDPDTLPTRERMIEMVTRVTEEHPFLYPSALITAAAIFSDPAYGGRAPIRNAGVRETLRLN